MAEKITFDTPLASMISNLIKVDKYEDEQMRRNLDLLKIYNRITENDYIKLIELLDIKLG